MQRTTPSNSRSSSSRSCRRRRKESQILNLEGKYTITESDCWEWNLYVSEEGYGTVSHQGKMRKAHVVAYEAEVGAIPKGLILDHLCRNRKCINPRHLEPVTKRENTLRGVGPTAINSRRTHCINGHEFNEENTKVRKGKWRQCRQCERDWSKRKRMERNKAP